MGQSDTSALAVQRAVVVVAATLAVAAKAAALRLS
jgi:hypothetical protein